MISKIWHRHVPDCVVDLNHMVFQAIQDITLDKNGVLYAVCFSFQKNLLVLVVKQDFAPNLKVENTELRLIQINFL